MSLYVCIKCPLTGTDLGEWDSEHILFKNILQVHKSHDGFGEGIIKLRRTVVYEATEYMDKNYHRMLHVLIHSCKGPTKCCLRRGAIDEI